MRCQQSAGSRWPVPCCALVWEPFALISATGRILPTDTTTLEPLDHGPTHRGPGGETSSR
jgi:hypothetical protein